MKIVNLKCENIKRISAVEITPSDNLVCIGGQNGAGKSSILDSILYALAGGSSFPDRPLRDGQDEGEIVIDLGEMTVTRKFKRKEDGAVTTSLEIKNKEGHKLSGPQQLLNNLYSKFTFDPLEFSRLKPAEQIETLKKLLGLDFTEIDAHRAAYYEERTDVNREKSRLLSLTQEHRIEIALAMGIQSSETYDDLLEQLGEPVSIQSLIDGLNAVEKENLIVDELKRKQEHHNIQCGNLEQRHQDLIKRIGDMQREADFLLEEKKLEVEAAMAVWQKLSSLKKIDTAEIRQQIVDAESKNEKIKMLKSFKDSWSKLIESCEHSNEITNKIAELDKKKLDMIKAAPLLVPGLSFDENGVKFNNIPLEQCSSAEKLRISVAMGIVMNPKLRVIQIRDGSLLDDAHLKMIHEMAVASNTQVWVERVGEKDECAIIISDGHVQL